MSASLIVQGKIQTICVRKKSVIPLLHQMWIMWMRMAWFFIVKHNQHQQTQKLSSFVVKSKIEAIHCGWKWTNELGFGSKNFVCVLLLSNTHKQRVQPNTVMINHNPSGQKVHQMHLGGWIQPLLQQFACCLVLFDVVLLLSQVFVCVDYVWIVGFWLLEFRRFWVGIG